MILSQFGLRFPYDIPSRPAATAAFRAEAAPSRLRIAHPRHALPAVNHVRSL